MGNPGHTRLVCQDQSTQLPVLSHELGAEVSRTHRWVLSTCWSHGSLGDVLKLW